MKLPNIPLPQNVERLLADLVAAAQACLREDLISIILFGSGAEGRLRPTSDLNLMFVLKRFEKERVDVLREPLRLVQVAGRAVGMFVLESELTATAEAFAVKFDDIGRRRRVLFGTDVIAGLKTSREAKIQRLRQILLNLTLRLRERYMTGSLREEQLAIVVAESAGPLRSAAATLLELEGKQVSSPREALRQFAGESEDAEFVSAVEQFATARESRSLPPGIGSRTVFQLLALAQALRLRTDKLA